MTKEEGLKKLKIEFLMLKDTDLYEWAVDRAYLTFCRVLDGYTQWVKEHCGKESAPKEKAKKSLLKEIADYFKKPPQDFDKWHRELATSLRKEYEEYNGRGSSMFTYGCAQKWINMAFKCLYAITDFSDLLGHPEIKASVFRYCHIPLDGYVLKNAAGVLQLAPQWEKTPWSRLDDYDKYKAYEDRLRQYAEAHDVIPLDLDFALWVKDDSKDFKKVRERLGGLGIKTP